MDNLTDVIEDMKASSNRIISNLETLKAELQAINDKIAAIRALSITRVSNRSMFKREMMENRIKGK